MRFRAIVASNVKRLRQRNGWTQGELAHYLERHKQTVWAIEAGRHGINDRLMDDLAELFQVSYAELIRPTFKEGKKWDASASEARDSLRSRYAADKPVRPRRPELGPVPFTDAEYVTEWIRLAAREAALTVLEEEGYRPGAPGQGAEPCADGVPSESGPAGG